MTGSRLSGSGLLLLLLPVLAACAAAENSGPCTVTQVAAFDLTLQHSLVFVPVTINGTKVQALMDTGAEKSAVYNSLVTKLQLLDDRRHGTVMSGVGGLGNVRNDALIERFEFAGYDPNADHYAVLDDQKVFAKDTDLGAIVGADFLSNFDLDLDEPNRRLTVYHVRACSGRFLPWTVPYSAVAMDTTWGGRLLVQATIDGLSLKALLDTGATSTFIDSAAAQRLGVTDAQLGREPNGRGSGAAGVDFTSTVHQFNTLEVGHDHFNHPRLIVLDRTLREADLLLGEDYLRQRHVWISYRTSQLFVAEPAK